MLREAVGGMVSEPYHASKPSPLSHVLMFSCLNKNHVLMSFNKNMFLCSHVFQKNMFSCLTAACVVRFGDRTSYASLNFISLIDNLLVR